MSTETLDEPCAIHPDRPTVGRCARCERPVCLHCAIPYRGETLCEGCAAKELGDPPPPPDPARRRPAARHAAAALALLGLASTVPPWHRSGTLTSAWSVWTAGLQTAATLAVGAAAAAAVLALLLLMLPRIRYQLASAGAALGAVAFATSGFMFLRTPDFFAFTPAPYVFLVAVGGVTGLLLRVARRR